MPARLLYSVFEKNLLRLSEENPSLKEFVKIVVDDYLSESQKRGFGLNLSFKQDLCEELEEIVRDMTLKKIYGSYSVGEYRRKNLK